MSAFQRIKMATPLSIFNKARPLEGANQFAGADRREFSHSSSRLGNGHAHSTLERLRFLREPFSMRRQAAEIQLNRFPNILFRFFQSFSLGMTPR